MPSIVVQTPEGAFSLWASSTLMSLGLKEADLEAAILAAPGPLVLDQLPLDRLSDAVAVYDQTRLRSGSGHRSIPDVILLTGDGDVVVVEVKRLGNPELRGRSVLAQVVDYAATLSATDEATLVGTLSNGRHRSWDTLIQEDLPTVPRPDVLAKRIRQRVADAELHLVVACDESPATLAEWVRAAGRQSALGFDLHVVEISPMVPRGDQGPIAWVPASRVATEIIHRTAVTVRTEGTATVQVDVTTASAEDVEEAIQPKGRSGRLEAAQAVLAPVADKLDLTLEALWEELDGIHRSALFAEWPASLASLSSPDDAGPHLRGRRADGFVEGRFGVNLLQHWTPSIFVGAYLLPVDHRQRLLAPEDGGDFALILDVLRNKSFDGDGFVDHPLFDRLRDRLRRESGAWDFADHIAQAKPNRWHPLHLRRPMAEVLGGLPTPEARQRAWLTAARDAVEVLLQGGELAELHAEFAD